MPCADAASPRKMLPPPMTTATSTPRARTSATSEAMFSSVAGSMPKPPAPMSASPDSLSRIRLKRGLAAGAASAMGGDYISETGLLGDLGGKIVLLLFQPLTQLPADEAPNLDVLAQLGHQLREQRPDGLLAVLGAHPDLVEQAHVLLPLAYLPVDNPVDHLRLLALLQRLGAEDLA